MRALFSTIVFISGLVFALQAQITTKEEPYSWGHKTEIKVPAVSFSPDNFVDDNVIDSINNTLTPFCFAHLIKTAINDKNSGIWIRTADGERLWMVSLCSPGAFSLNITLSGFNFGQNIKLWVYNQSKTDYVGAITNLNNNKDSILAIRPVAGDTLIIELLIPSSNAAYSFSISRIGHDFLGIFANNKKDGLYGHSGSCNVDIQCFEGNNWQTEKHSVCRLIASNIYLGSGALINNTANDGTPYLLTANHVIMNQQRASNTVFYFNYESPSCHGPDGNSSQTISGCTLVATKYDETGKLDFSLVKLSSKPPREYMPYYSGWNRNEVISGVATCIHHPSGDVKKISISETVPVSASFTGFDPNVFWKVNRWIVGTTEGGSSGSPLFDINHKIIGSLTGGDANCSYPYNDFFQKFSAAWNKYPDSTQQLAYWLDPSDTQVLTLDGYNPYAQGTTWTDLITLTNFNPNDHPTLYLANDGGYLAGNNVFGDKAKAEYYEPSDYGYRTHIKGLFFYFGKATGNPMTNIQAALWRQTSGQPSAIMAYATLNLGTIINQVANEEYSYAEFPLPVLIPGPFYAGVILPSTPGDTIALVTNAEGESTVNTGWEMNSSNIWLPYDSPQSWGVMLANAVYPVAGRLISAIEPLPQHRYELTIFPNPSTGNFYVDIPYELRADINSRLSIYNTSGQIVKQQQIIPGKTLYELLVDKPGFYIVTLTAGDKFATGKLVISDY